MESENMLVESGTESIDSSQENQSDITSSEIPEEIGQPPETIERTEAVTLIPIQEEELTISDWGFIGFGAAGISLIVSLALAAIIRIFWRSAS